MKKKMLALIMAIAMIASLAVPAFAGGNSGNSEFKGDVTVTGTTKKPTLTITLPASDTLVLNPYKITVNGSNAQIISAGNSIKNESDVAVKVGVTATATIAGGTTLSAKACTGKETTKSVFAFVEFQKGPAAGEAAAAIPTTGWTSDFSAVNAKVFPQVIPVTGDGTTNADLETLPAKGANANFLYYKVLGNAANDPTGGWNDTDTLSVKLAFTFTPTVPKDVIFADAFEDDSNDDYKAEAEDRTMQNIAEISNVAPAMNTIVRITPKKTISTAEDAVDATITAVTAFSDDGNNTAVTVTKVSDDLYWFKTPATGVVVKVTGTAATPED